MFCRAVKPSHIPWDEVHEEQWGRDLKNLVNLGSPPDSASISPIIMVLCRSILCPRFFVSFSIFLPSHGLPAWIPIYLLCCALAKTASSLSISWGGIALNSFYRHTTSSLRMSRPPRSTLSGSSSMCIGLFYSSSFDLWWILRARAASISMVEDCMVVSGYFLFQGKIKLELMVSISIISYCYFQHTLSTWK